MAEHIHKTYTCDRCKAEIEPPSLLRTRVEARLVNLAGSVSRVEWCDLCSPCRADVHAFFRSHIDHNNPETTNDPE